MSWWVLLEENFGRPVSGYRVKKLSDSQYTRFRIRQRRAAKARTKWNAYLRRKRRGKPIEATSEDPVNKERIQKIRIPEILSLRANTDETLHFLEAISRQTNRSRKSRRRGADPITSYFDFTELREICPATALVLCSHYDVYHMRGGALKAFDYDDWSAEVKETFAKIGFFKWLEFQGVEDSYDYPAHLPIEAFESETVHDPEIPVTYLQKLVEAFNLSRESEAGSVIREDTSRRVASAILEGVENSVRHAYNAGSPKDVRRRWWVGGVSNPSSGEVLVACYDCGMSIPGSIAASDLEDRHGVRRYVQGVISRFLEKSREPEEDNSLDHKRLKVALRYLASTSGRDGGGKGLSHIASTIDKCEDGEVEIFTRRAHFSVRKGGRPRSKLLPVAMPGTLIIWRVQLNGAANRGYR